MQILQTEVHNYCQNFRGGSLGQVEAVDVAKVFFDFEEDSQSDFTFGTSAVTFGSVDFYMKF